MKILLTAFNPFGGESVNPAELAAARVQFPGHTLKKLTIPTEYARCETVLSAALDEFSPDILLMIGQAGGRAAVTPERVAINVDDSGAADNAGEVRKNQPIAPDGPAAYFATLPIHRIADAIKAAGIPAAISNSAGTFVCNHLMYTALSQVKAPAIAGFVHVPFLPEQAEKRGAPSMPLGDMVRAIEIALAECVDFQKSR